MEMVKIKVLLPLIKNGAEVSVGTKMEMELQTAFRHQRVGDVEILEPIETEIQEIEVARKI